MARRQKFNLSSDLTEVLNKQKPFAKRGYSLAKDAISLLESTVHDVSQELQAEIDRLYEGNFRDDATTNSLSEQLNRIRSDYFILPEKMKEDVNSINKSVFSITVFGRTMTGKSTLMEILTHGDGASIGNGKQRFTRDVRTYTYKKLQITDVPGVAAFEGQDDENIAFDAAKKCDLIVFLINDDDVQPDVTECLGRIFSIGKPVVCIVNVKQSIADDLNEKELKFFKSRLDKKMNNDRLDAIKRQLFEYGRSYGQDWHSIRFAYVHLKAAYMAQQDKYSEWSNYLFDYSRFEYVDNLIINEVSDKGSFYKLKSYADIVTVPLVDAVETLYDQSAENSRQGSIYVEKGRNLRRWNENFETNAKTQIETYLTSVSSKLKREVASFAEDNYDNPNANANWNEFIEKQMISEGAQRLLNQLSKECESELKEISREVDFEIKFSFMTKADDTLKMRRIVDGRRVWNWTTSILSGGLTIAGLFTGGALTLIGLGIAGLGALGNFFFKDYEKKATDARIRLERKLTAHIDKTVNILRKRMLDVLYKDLIKGHLYPMVSSLSEAVSSLFALSDAQYDFAGRLNSKLEEINKTSISEVLVYSGFQGLEWHIEDIARIPGSAVIIVLGDGKRFPDDAVRQLHFLLKENIWFVFKKDNIKSILCQAIGRGIDRETIRIQKINDRPRIAHIPSLEKADAITKVRIRLAQQLTGLLIMK